MNWQTRRLGFLLTVVIGSMVCGCDSEGGKGKLKGTISVNGVPLKGGLITFIPSSGKGDPFNARIIDGKFEGLELPYGKARAYVIADTVGGRSVDQGDVRPMAKAKASTEVPEKYQSIETSELEVDIKPGENVFERDLK